MNKKIIFVILALASVTLLAITITDEAVDTRQHPVTANTFGSENKPVYVAGCKTMDAPVPPKKTYPTVTRNFVARVCALEVIPPYGVLIAQRDESVREAQAAN